MANLIEEPHNELSNPLHSPKDAEQARPQVNMPCHEFKDAC
jgi:hypothetical protein